MFNVLKHGNNNLKRRPFFSAAARVMALFVFALIFLYVPANAGGKSSKDVASKGTVSKSAAAKDEKPLEDKIQDKAPEKAPEKIVTSASSRFVDNGDGTVIDKNTSKMWLKNANIARYPMSWQSAQKFIQEMNDGTRPNYGYTNWRIPSKSDFETLVDQARFYPALPEDNPFIDVENQFYWTSSTGTDLVDYIMVVDMAYGSRIMDYVSSCNYHYLWPVRANVEAYSTATGTVLTAGMNDHGQLGDGTLISRPLFQPVKDLDNVMKVVAGMEHAIAIKTDGTIWAWGRNKEGQLGIGGTKDAAVPTLVKGLWNVIDIAAGMYHTVALKSDGTVWAWGRNSYGQLGNDVVKDADTPIQVNGLTDIVKLSAGMYHTLALRKDGTVWAWGWNLNGQLGAGLPDEVHKPVQVKDLTDVVDIAAGLHHSLALKKDGTVWTWGWSAFDPLAEGMPREKSLPKQVPGLTDVVDIAAGLHHCLALKKDGTVWAWGMNEYKQLGFDSAGSVSEPRLIPKLTKVKAVEAGMYHSVALMSDGSVRIWGKDQENSVEKNVPVRIRDVSDVLNVSAGKYFTVITSAADESK